LAIAEWTLRTVMLQALALAWPGLVAVGAIAAALLARGRLRHGLWTRSTCLACGFVLSWLIATVLAVVPLPKLVLGVFVRYPWLLGVAGALVGFTATRAAWRRVIADSRGLGTAGPHK
jgi:hypothetical protein